MKKLMIIQYYGQDTAEKRRHCIKCFINAKAYQNTKNLKWIA